MKTIMNPSASLTAAVILTGALAGGAQAALVSIDVEYEDRMLEFNDVVSSTGGISMSIVVDTDSPNLGTSFNGLFNFYDADVFFTAPGLGLENELIVSDTFLFFAVDVHGFTDTVSSFTTIFTASGGPDALAFGTRYDLSTLVVPQGPVSNTTNELRTSNDIVFANGDRITGGGTAQAASLTTVSEIPEPSSALLVGVGVLERVRFAP